MFNHNRFLLLLLFGVMLVLQPTVGHAGMAYDLTNEWSNTSNGASDNLWTYRNGSATLPFLTDWKPLLGGFVQSAWAPSNTAGDYLSAWFQATQNDLGWLKGDVIVHTTDTANGVSEGAANVIWTSPNAGTVDISGSLFEGRVRVLRPQRWSILLNNTVLSSGGFLPNGEYTRDQPMVFNSTTLKNVSVRPGDTIQLLFDVMPLGDFIGVNLKITEVAEVPEPTTMSLAAFSLAFVMYRFRRRRA